MSSSEHIFSPWEEDGDDLLHGISQDAKRFVAHLAEYLAPRPAVPLGMLHANSFSTKYQMQYKRAL